MEGVGNLGLLQQKKVAHVMEATGNDPALESEYELLMSVSINNSTINIRTRTNMNPFQGPGSIFASGTGFDPPILQFMFPKEIVVNGMKVTTHKDRALRSMRVRANADVANPNDFESQPNLLHPIQDVRRQYETHSPNSCPGLLHVRE